MRGPQPKQRISRERLDRLLLNPALSQALLEDLGYSSTHKAAREMGRGLLGAGWIAYLPSATAGRSEALLLAPNGRICKLENDQVRSSGAIEILQATRRLSFVDAVIELEATYLGHHSVSPAELAQNRKLPAARRIAAAEDAKKRARTTAADRPGLQPAARDELTPEQALRVARQRFAAAVPDPGTGYLVTKRYIDPTIIRRFGADLGRWATLRYDEVRDEVMIAHLNADGRFVGYEYRGGVTSANRRGSRGYATLCTIGLAILGDLATATRLVMTESGIEALSLCELEGEASRETVYVSCSGGPKAGQAERVAAWAAQSGGIVCLAYNADRAGENFRRSVREALTKFEVPEAKIHNLAPEPGADWNITLKTLKRIEDRDVLEWRAQQPSTPSPAGGYGTQD